MAFMITQNDKTSYTLSYNAYDKYSANIQNIRKCKARMRLLGIIFRENVQKGWKWNLQYKCSYVIVALIVNQP